MPHLSRHGARFDKVTDVLYRLPSTASNFTHVALDIIERAEHPLAVQFSAQPGYRVNAEGDFSVTVVWSLGKHLS